MNAKKVIISSAILFIVIGSIKAQEPVVFNDPALEAAIREALGIPTDPIMPADMLNLTSFDAQGRGIVDLIGLEYATKLTELWLSHNQISDLSPLAYLSSLTHLSIFDNQIADLSALEGLTQLTFLNMPLNLVTDLQPLTGLTNLTLIVAWRNSISDLTPLTGLTNLERLDVDDNLITDLSPLAGLTSLKRLALIRNPISDISSLAGLAELRELWLSDIPITNISPIFNLTNLTILDLRGNGTVSDISFVAGLPNLVDLLLDKNQISDITPIMNAANSLTRLDLGNNQISNVSPLAGATNLQRLSLGNNQISDISPLSGLTNLTELRLGDNQISDLSPLSELMNLQSLNLMDNPLNLDACTIYIPQIIENNPGITVLQNSCTDPGSLLVNGGFESGAMSPWKKYANPPVVIKTGVVQELTGASIPENPIEGNYCLHVEVSETGANFWDAGVLHDGLVFQAGKKYTLSAFLKCKEGTLQINFKPEMTGEPWTGYGEQQFTMTDQWAEYSVTTPVFFSDVSPAQVTFHVGFADGEFWMDDVRLTEEDAPPDVVYFPDQNLKQAVIDALAGIGIYTTDPTESQMANLTQLYAGGRGIVDLTGIEHAVNLTLLSADYNQISDLSPLLGLTNLTYLEMRENEISDLSPLSGLTNLITLILERNQIGDISPLAGLTNLTDLRLWSNPITDISPLSGLTNLTRLTLAGTQVSDINPLSAMTNLTTLVLENSQISDLNPISGMTNLTELRLWSNQITDISSLAGLTNLKLLTLGKNQISDISLLAGLVNIKELQLSPNQISDLSPLTGLMNLEKLELGDNQITDVSPLAGLTNLTLLNLEYNQISDISPLSELMNLTTLTLYGTNQISDISPLSGLTNLTVLGLDSNQISDFSPLSGLLSLIKLTLNETGINNLSLLTELTNLRVLRLHDNAISDISPLTALTTFEELILTSCPLSWESYCTWLPNIQANNPDLTNLQVDPNPYNCDVPPEETPVGTSVPVTPEDNTYPDTHPVTLTFEEITESGGTTLVTSESGPTPPSGFQLGDPPTYYDISTTATYSGLIEICVSYSDVSYSGPEELLKLYHYDGGSWVDCTTLVDTENDIICGEVSSLSAFAILLPEAPEFQSITAAPNILWPPNHKMVPITVTCIVLDDTDPNPAVELKSITMNEGDETNTYDPQFDTTIGDGHTIDDIQIIDGVIYLRAERSGTGTGRIYTLTYEATDDAGNVGTASVTVTVPHEAP